MEDKLQRVILHDLKHGIKNKTVKSDDKYVLDKYVKKLRFSGVLLWNEVFGGSGERKSNKNEGYGWKVCWKMLQILIGEGII